MAQSNATAGIGAEAVRMLEEERRSADQLIFELEQDRETLALQVEINGRLKSELDRERSLNAGSGQKLLELEERYQRVREENQNLKWELSRERRIREEFRRAARSPPLMAVPAIYVQFTGRGPVCYTELQD